MKPRALLPLVLAAVAMAWLVVSWGYVEDDALIHIEFAQNLAHGNGFTFDGKNVYGDSSPAWVLLLAGFLRAGLSLTYAAKAASILGVIVCAVGVARIGLVLLVRPAYRTALWLLVALHPFTLFWMFAGMETLAAIGVASWLLASIGAPGTRPRPFWRIVDDAIEGLAPLLRFELLPLTVAAAVSRSRDRGERWLATAARVAAAVAPFAAWTVYAKVTFGTWGPTTNSAKRIVASSKLAGIAEAVVREASVMASGFGVLLVLYAAYLFWPRKRQGRAETPASLDARWWAVVAWPLAALAFYAVNRTAMQTRYGLPIGFFLGAALLSYDERSRGRRRPPWVVLAPTLGAYITLFFLTVVPFVSNKATTLSQMTAFLEEMKLQVPPSEPVACYSVGLLALKLDNPIVDTGGIMLSDMIPALAGGMPLIDWIRSKGARCVVAGEPPSSRHVELARVSLPAIGWYIRPSAFRAEYPSVLYCEPDLPRP